MPTRMLRAARFAAALLPCALARVVAQPDIAQTGVAAATRMSSVIKLDGVLDEPAWTTARPLTGFTQREPTEGAPASDVTRVTFVYDHEALYIGARMESRHPDAIRPQVARRDHEGNAEQLIVSFDTFGDRRTAYTFSVTSGGVRVDYYHGSDNESARDYTFDPVWQATTRVDGAGWTAELRIPFSQLPFNAAAEQQWGVNVVRLVPARNESAYWMLVKRNETGWSSRMGRLTGLRDIRPSRRVELTPYVASDSRLKSRVNAADPFDVSSQSGVRAGGDVTIGLGPNATLAATINPDFGQVEADPAVVNLSAFEVFFPERRPFFTSGMQLLNSRGAFYSRRIGAAPTLNPGGTFADVPRNSTILGAAKVSGRLPSKLSFAGLTALTARETARTFDASSHLTTTDVEVAPRTWYGAAAVQQEFGRDGSTVYGMLTATDRDERPGSLAAQSLAQRAYTGLADTRLRWGGGRYDANAYIGFSHVVGDSLAITAQQRSSRRYYQRPDVSYVHLEPGRHSLSGYAAGINHSKLSGQWLWDIDVFAESPGYELNDIGRLGGADDLGTFSSVRYRQTTRGALFHNWDVAFNHITGWDFGGTRNFTNLELSSNQTYKNFWTSQLTLGYDTPAFDDQLTRGGPLMATYPDRYAEVQIANRAGAQTGWSLSTRVKQGDDGGYDLDASASLTLRPGSRLELSLAPGYSGGELARQYVTTRTDGTAATFGSRYVFAHVDRDEYSMQMRLNFALTPNVTLETYVEPFAASGRYFKYGELLAARAKDLKTYGTLGTSISAPDSSGARRVTDGANAFTLSRNDFSVRSFRSNAVLRWEWRPGSTLFVVWQQDRASDLTTVRPVRPGALWDALHADGTQVLAVKATYWLPLR